MKTEFEKMRNEEMYYFSDPEVENDILRAQDLCAKFSNLTLNSPDYRATLRELIPGIPDSSCICPPFRCDHGNGIIMGENVFLNYNCVILDGAFVRFGDHVKVGPNCQFYTPQHPFDNLERREPKETSFPIEIGEDSWLGGGVIVLPGVKIGKRCIIGAGSVVTHDIPDDSMAVGNPARVIKSIKDR